MSAKTMNGSERETSVKRILRHRRSQEYFRRGGWTSNPEEADTFADVVEVAEACAKYGLSDVELAVRLNEADCDVFCTPIR